LLPLYARKSNSLALPGECVGNVDYLLQHGAHSVISNATHHVAHYVKPEVHNVLHCRQKRIQPRPQSTCTENFVKFGHVVSETWKRTNAQTDGHRDTLIAILCTDTGGGEEIISSPAGAVAKYCDEYVCVSVCLPARISPEPHARSLSIFLCLLPMPVARSSSGMLMIGRIAYRRKCGDGSAQRGRSVIYDCLVGLKHVYTSKYVARIEMKRAV